MPLSDLLFQRREFEEARALAQRAYDAAKDGSVPASEQAAAAFALARATWELGDRDARARALQMGTDAFQQYLDTEGRSAQGAVDVCAWLQQHHHPCPER